MEDRIFKNRTEAGQLLAAALDGFRPDRPLVVALPRGGVPVAYAVARKLGAPIEVLVVKKISAPSNPSLTIGALAEGEELFVNREEVEILGVPEVAIHEAVVRCQEQLKRQAISYRHGRSMAEVRGRTVIVVDDGFATGATAVAALKALKGLGAAKIIFAVPVCSADAELLIHSADPDVPIVYLQKPSPFWSVSVWYDDFEAVSEIEIAYLLENARSGGEATHHREVKIPCGTVCLSGTVFVPANPRAVIIVANGAGHSRFAEKRRFIATYLEKAGFAVFQADLLTADEVDDQTKKFDVALCKTRLAAAVRWVNEQKWAKLLAVGLFGSSTASAAILAVAAEQRGRIYAVVSAGGSPDVLKQRLSAVEAPTLLIVGAQDATMLALNQEADAELPNSELSVIAQAGALFDTPGTLELVAQQTKDWFLDHLKELKTYVAA